MRSIALRDTGSWPVEAFTEAAELLRQGRLVCLPCGGTYRIAADLGDRKAVLRLFQAKRRTREAPTLVFVSDPEMLGDITPSVDPLTEQLIREYWPGRLTVMVEPELDLPRKIVKQMCKKRGRIGVRMPASIVARGVVSAFGGPLLVSSANIEKKQGAYSAAQVRKNFFSSVDLFFDADDLASKPSSTVVNVQDGLIKVIREGAVSEAEIAATTAG
jgi:L-threonylcarbamoyladenylate synthase